MFSHLEQDSTDDSDFVRLQRLNHGPSFASSQEELDLYFGELKSAVILIDKSSRIFYFNDAAFHLNALLSREIEKGIQITELISKILLPDSLINFYESLISKKYFSVTSDFLINRIEKLSMSPIGFEGFVVKITFNELQSISTSNLFNHFDELPITYFGFSILPGKRLNIKFLSENFDDFFPHIPTAEAIKNDKLFVSYFHPADLPSLLKKIVTLKQGKKSIQLELRMLNEKKEYIWHRLTVGRFVDRNSLDYFLGYLESIHDIKMDEINRQHLIYETLEEERNRIAMELHDDLGQQLVALNLYINSLSDSSESSSPGLTSAKEIASKAILQMKSLIYNLVPPEMDNGLEKTLENFFGRLNEASNPAQFHFKCGKVNSDLFGNDISYHIFRIVQEFVSNSLKYSKCANVYCRIHTSQGRPCIELADDGKGFEISTVKKGLGLENMQKRSRIIGAKLDMQSSPGAGTIVSLTL